MTQLMNVREVARTLGVHENTVRRWEERGLLARRPAAQRRPPLPSRGRRGDARGDVQRLRPDERGRRRRPRHARALDRLRTVGSHAPIVAAGMGPGEHRPHDHEYWTAPWSTTLFAGDLFEAIPFGDQPTVIYTGEEGPRRRQALRRRGRVRLRPAGHADVRHGRPARRRPRRIRIASSFPSFRSASSPSRQAQSPQNEKLLRSRDTIHPYMYLPPLAGVLEEESVACLFRPSLVSDELLADPPRRIAQLQPPARRHLKVKLAAYWAASPRPESFPCTSATRSQLARLAGHPAHMTRPSRCSRATTSSTDDAAPGFVSHGQWGPRPLAGSRRCYRHARGRRSETRRAHRRFWFARPWYAGSLRNVVRFVRWSARRPPSSVSLILGAVTALSRPGPIA